MGAEQMLGRRLSIESDSETRQRHRHITDAATRWARAEHELEAANVAYTEAWNNDLTLQPTAVKALHHPRVSRAKTELVEARAALLALFPDPEVT